MKAKYSIIDIFHILLIKDSCRKHTEHFTVGSKHTIWCTRFLTGTWHFSSPTNTWQLSHTIFIIRCVSLFLLGFPGGDSGKEPTCQSMQETQETRIRYLDWEEALEEGMATHSSILAWRIPWTEEPGGLQSVGSHKVRYN